jgi:hypothetical protein
VYAGKDGNVYRNNDGTWQKYDNGNWNNASVSPETKANAQQRAETARSNQSGTGIAGSADPGGTRSSGVAREQASSFSQSRGSSDFSDLNRDAQARQRGTERTQSFQNYERSSGSSGFSRGGGGRAGGRAGGRRR